MQIRDRVRELRRVPADKEWHDAFEKAGHTSAVDEWRPITFVLPTCGPLLAARGSRWATLAQMPRETACLPGRVQARGARNVCA